MSCRGSARKKDSAQEVLQNRTVVDHLPLVMAIAARVRENLPLHVDLDDLITAGLRGLFAATKNRHRKNLVFHSYARHRIKAAILESVRTGFSTQPESPDSMHAKEELSETAASWHSNPLPKVNRRRNSSSEVPPCRNCHSIFAIRVAGRIPTPLALDGVVPDRLRGLIRS